jgi:excisionase family DNA binding protein
MASNNSPSVADTIEELLEEQRNDVRKAVGLEIAADILGISLATVRRDVSEGRIASFLDGRKRLIPMLAIYSRLRANLEASGGGGGDAPKKAHGYRGLRPHEMAKAGARK